MESKTVKLSVLLVIMSLIMAQTQVDGKSCCPSSHSRTIYTTCYLSGSSRRGCALLSGCQIVQGTCPGGYSNHGILENSADAINEYCNLGCVSSVCGSLTTLQNSDVSEIVNGAVEQCTKACSSFCAKGSKTALETV